jgi:hypothetical protein
LVVIDADAEDCAAERGDAFLELLERGGFFDARRAPCGPEIQEDHFAAEVGKVDGFAAGGDGKIGSGFAGEAGLALAVVGRDEEVKEPGNEEKDGGGGQRAFWWGVQATYDTKSLRGRRMGIGDNLLVERCGERRHRTSIQ